MICACSIACDCTRSGCGFNSHSEARAALSYARHTRLEIWMKSGKRSDEPFFPNIILLAAQTYQQ